MLKVAVVLRAPLLPKVTVPGPEVWLQRVVMAGGWFS